MSKVIIALVGMLVVGGGIYAYSSNQEKAATVEQKMMGTEGMETENMMKEDDGTGMVDTARVSQMDAEGVMAKAGTYEAYSADKLARADMGDVVLFFHAAWCPSCRGLDASIENNLESIPEGVSILQLDYDTETELKKKYGVTHQHTLVQVDQDGNMIKKWSGSGSLDALLAQIE